MKCTSAWLPARFGGGESCCSRANRGQNRPGTSQVGLGWLSRLWRRVRTMRYMRSLCILLLLFHPFLVYWCRRGLACLGCAYVTRTSCQLPKLITHRAFLDACRTRALFMPFAWLPFVTEAFSPEVVFPGRTVVVHIFLLPVLLFQTSFSTLVVLCMMPSIRTKPHRALSWKSENCFMLQPRKV